MTESSTKVVEFKRSGPKRTIDLRQDNRIGALLDEYEDANVAYLEAKRVRDELRGEIKSKMAGADVALVDGWRLKMPWVFRKEFIVKASEFQRMYLKRSRPRSKATPK